ncbi:MAG: MobC family plasmid mobilization relaxosome protein [Clostridium sp.]|nr:MobC family plasmid mobilization relaxosome protein [Clostridium sp.]
MADKKEIIKPFRMTKVEAEQLKQQAEARHLTESAYMRLLLSQKPSDYPEIRTSLKNLINEVNRIGNNINQITRNHNSGLYSQFDRERLMAYMRKLNLAVKDVVDKVGDQ